MMSLLLNMFLSCAHEEVLDIKEYSTGDDADNGPEVPFLKSLKFLLLKFLLLNMFDIISERDNKEAQAPTHGKHMAAAKRAAQFSDDMEVRNDGAEMWCNIVVYLCNMMKNFAIKHIKRGAHQRTGVNIIVMILTRWGWGGAVLSKRL